MGKFNEYSQKATPADNDTLMIYDATSKANKLSPFSGIWNWIVEKLTNAVISNLQTSNQTVLGAINELNSKASRFNGNIKKVGFRSGQRALNNILIFTIQIIQEQVWHLLQMEKMQLSSLLTMRKNGRLS